MKRDGRCAEKHHLRVRRLPPADLGDGRDDPARQQAAAHRLVLGRTDGDATPTASLPCSSRNSSVSALTAALGCSPTSSAGMVDPERNPLSGLVEIDEASLPFRTKDDPPTGGQGTQPRRQDAPSAPSNSGTPTTSQAACGWPKSPPTAPPTSFVEPPPISENRHLVRLRCGPRRSPCPCRREDRRSPRPAGLLEKPQRMGASRRLPRAGRKHLQAYLDEFVIRFNRCKRKPRCFRSALPPPCDTNCRTRLPTGMLIEPEPWHKPLPHRVVAGRPGLWQCRARAAVAQG